VLKDMMGEKRLGVLIGSTLLYTTMKFPQSHDMIT